MLKKKKRVQHGNGILKACVCVCLAAGEANTTVDGSEELSFMASGATLASDYFALYIDVYFKSER